MRNTTLQWILWAVTMAVFLWLTLTSRWDWLIVAMVASSLVWYKVVPRTSSRQQLGERKNRY